MTDEMFRIALLTRLQDAYNTQDWEMFRIGYLYFKVNFPGEAATFCEHLTGEAKNVCLDTITDIENKI